MLALQKRVSSAFTGVPKQAGVRTTPGVRVVFTWPTGSFHQFPSQRHKVTIPGGSVSETGSPHGNWDTCEERVNFWSCSAFHGLVFSTHSCWVDFYQEHRRGGCYARWYLLLLKLTSAFRDIMLFIHELRYLLQMPKPHSRWNLSNFQSYWIHRVSKLPFLYQRTRNWSSFKVLSLLKCCLHGPLSLRAAGTHPLCPGPARCAALTQCSLHFCWASEDAKSCSQQ